MLWYSYCRRSYWRAEPKGQSFLLRTETMWPDHMMFIQLPTIGLISEVWYTILDKKQNELIWKIRSFAQISLNIFFRTQIIWNDFLAFLGQFIYLLSRPNGTMQLYQFVIISGVLMLVLVQIPSFHSLRHINLVSLVLCLSFCASATAGSIYIGKQSQHN